MSWCMKKRFLPDGDLSGFDVGHYTPVDSRGLPAELSFKVLKTFWVEDEHYDHLCWEDKDAMAFSRAASLVSFLNGGPTPPEDSRWDR